MKKIIIIIIFLSTIVNAQSKLTLRESLEIGLKNSREIQINNSKLNAAEAKHSEFKANFLPKLSAGGTYMYMNKPPIQFSLPTLPGMAAQQSEGSVRSTLLNVSLEQPLFMGMRLWSLKKSAEYNSLAAKEELSLSQNEYALKIYDAYWGLFKLEKADKLIDETLNSMKQHLADAENMMKNGMATRSDYLKIKQKTAEVQLQKIEIQNNLQLAKTNFKQVLGLDLQSNADIEPHSEELGLTLMEFDSLYSEALNKREELKSIDYKIKAGEELTTASRADYFPQIGISGSLYYLKVDGESLPISKDAATFWNIGLNLKWTLWDWWGTSSKVSQAQEQVIQGKLKQADLKEMIYLEVYKNYLTLKKMKEKLNVMDLSIEASSENLRIIQNQFKQNTATSSELMDAETDLLKSKTDYMAAVADFQTARAALEKSVGRRIY